eukprot:scaffold18777_cov173-Skeletonema_menzelii.AAC.1
MRQLCHHYLISSTPLFLLKATATASRAGEDRERTNRQLYCVYFRSKFSELSQEMPTRPAVQSPV